MLRVAIVGLLLVLATGCGATEKPTLSTAGWTPFDQVFRMAVVVVFASTVGYLAFRRRRGTSARQETARDRLLIAVLVSSVTTTAFLASASRFLNVFTELEIRTLATFAVIAWASFLLLRFVSVIQDDPSLGIARVGAVFSALQVLAALPACWINVNAPWLWRLALSSFILTFALMHATWVLQMSPRSERRWLVRIVMWIDVALLLLLTGFVWEVTDRLAYRSQIVFLLVSSMLVGTILVEVRRRYDSLATTGPRPRPLFRRRFEPAVVHHCISCGSTDLRQEAGFVVCNGCSARFRAEAGSVAGA